MRLILSVIRSTYEKCYEQFTIALSRNDWSWNNILAISLEFISNGKLFLPFFSIGIFSFFFYSTIEDICVLKRFLLRIIPKNIPLPPSTYYSFTQCQSRFLRTDKNPIWVKMFVVVGSFFFVCAPNQILLLPISCICTGSFYCLTFYIPIAYSYKNNRKFFWYTSFPSFNKRDNRNKMHFTLDYVIGKTLRVLL